MLKRKRDTLEGIDLENMKRKIFSIYRYALPDSVYALFEFLYLENPENPCEALACLGLSFKGPYEVMQGKFDSCESKENMENIHLHFRYSHDPAECLTFMILNSEFEVKTSDGVEKDEGSSKKIVVKGSDKSSLVDGHYVIHRDDPSKANESFIAYNSKSLKGEFEIVGSNVFTGIDDAMKRRGIIIKKSKNKDRDDGKNTTMLNFVTHSKATEEREEVEKASPSAVFNRLSKFAKERGFPIFDQGEVKSNRKKEATTTTMNKLSLKVPVDKKTQVGYRSLNYSEKELQVMFDSIALHKGDTSKLLEEINWCNIANDECDFGMSLELGLNLFSSHLRFTKSACKLLKTSYALLNRAIYAEIIEKHANLRERENLSVL